MDTKKPAIKQVFYLIDPFEVREVLQVKLFALFHKAAVSIPLKSGRCCKKARARREQPPVSLNPFEVREVLQACGRRINAGCRRLNPFEVREVLQAHLM